MRNTHVIQKLVIKYKLDHPLSFLIKLRIFRNKARIYTNVHQSAGKKDFGLKSSSKIRYLLALIGIDISPAAGARAAYASMAAGAIAFATVMIAVFNLSVRDVRLIEGPGIPVYALGEPVIRKADGKLKPFARGMNIAVNDTIECADNAAAFFKLDRHSALIWGKTSAAIDGVEPGTDIRLGAGNAGFRVDPLAAGESFTIKTARAVIRVKGTMFTVRSSDRETIVSVREGVVVATQISTGDTADVRAGNTAVIGETMVVRESTAREKEILSFIDGKISGLSTVAEESAVPILSDLLSNMPVEKEEKKRVSLNDIRAKYGRLDEVTLFSGQTIQGAIISTGGFVTIATPDGIRKISVKDVKGSRSL